jgi:hypothetical protein
MRTEFNAIAQRKYNKYHIILFELHLRWLHYAYFTV